MKPVIQVQDISKSYIINHKDRASYSTIKDDFSHLLTSPFSKKESVDEKFWALKNVSFEIMPGEIFGIIGKNGSGKSTLLKILSRVVEPTEGSIVLNGKTASLLEVGTGFHPELTGRENVYFNGSMLGMTRKEIQSKFNEILEFSEIEQFIDTPVKFYSSGMYVRLAFSVAAHLNPDILILDEVLSVGDAAFQKKSMKKIKSIMEDNGTTVLFVSHSMALVKEICDKALLLDRGKVKFLGDSEFVTEKYLGNNLHANISTSFVAEAPKPQETSEDNNSKKDDARLLNIELQNLNGEKVDALDLDQDWQLYIKYQVNQPCERTIVSVEILGSDDQVLYMTTDTDKQKSIPTKEPGIYEVNVTFDSTHFIPGTYYIRTAIQSPGVTLYDKYEDLPLRIRQNTKDIRAKFFKGKYMGYITDKSTWQVVKK